MAEVIDSFRIACHSATIRSDDSREVESPGRRASGSSFRSATADDLPGMGPVTALTTGVLLGDVKRLADGKALASYVGMIPREYSSGERQRLGALTKNGGPLLRFLWGEAGAHGARRDPELLRFWRRKLVQKGLGKASAAVARKLGVRLFSCCRMRSIITSSVVADRRSRKAVNPVRGCQKRRTVRTATGRLIRLLALAEMQGVRIIHHGADHDSTFRTATQLYESTACTFLMKALGK
jgi:Transposase IS116/IS110/IS902 family